MPSALQVKCTFCITQLMLGLKCALRVLNVSPALNCAVSNVIPFLQVERLLSEIDGIIYLLDYTKLKTIEEAQIFGKLRQLNPRLVKRLSKRLFFVVSMSILQSDS